MKLNTLQQDKVVEIKLYICSHRILSVKYFVMKLKNSILVLGWLVIMLFNLQTFAQDSNYSLIKKELTKEQIALLQKEKEMIKSNREAFKASLTSEQLNILRNKTLSKAEIRKQLVATFSREQKNMVQSQQVRLRKTRETFRKSLTSEQRKMLKERIDKIRNTKDRGELKDGPRVRDADGKKRRSRSN